MNLILTYVMIKINMVRAKCRNGTLSGQIVLFHLII